MGLIKVASRKDLASGEKMGAKAGRKKILLANLNGEFFGIGNVCTHMGCVLSEGDIIGEGIECPCHGSIFDVKTGKVLKGPAKKPAPVFKVKIEGDEIFVDV